jgi:hypothetical protein
LSELKLSTLPEAIGQLTQLQVLDLYDTARIPKSDIMSY